MSLWAVTNYGLNKIIKFTQHIFENSNHSVNVGVHNHPRTMILDVLLYILCALHVTDKYKDKHKQPLVVLHLCMAKQEFMLRPLRKVVTEEDVTHLVTGKVTETMTMDLLGNGTGKAVRVLPLLRGQTLRFNCVIMTA